MKPANCNHERAQDSYTKTLLIAAEGCFVILLTKSLQVSWITSHGKPQL
jgi:hypothetical protein